MKIFIIVIILTFGLYPQEEIENVKYCLGVVAGSPINVNLTTGLYFNNYSARLSGGVWIYDRYGAQLDLTYVFLSADPIQHQVAFISAYAHNQKYAGNNFFYIIYHGGVEEGDYINSFYFGIAYNFLWKGLFIQTGSAWGTGNFEKPRFIMQLGYIHYFD